jgi:hypothetical protein
VANRQDPRQETRPLERPMPTGGQVEPSAQLKAVPIGYNPFFSVLAVAPLTYTDYSNIYSNKGVL